MSAVSKVPAFIDALVACFTAVLGSDDVNDGPGASAPNGTQYVYVGCDDPESEDWLTAVEATQEWAWLGHSQRREEAGVHCLAVAWNGDSDQQAARVDVYALMKTITDAIETDPSLGDTVTWTVGVTSHALQYRQEAGGAAARIPFTVSFVAYT